MRQIRIALMDYDFAEMVGKFMKYTGKFDLRKDLLRLISNKSDPEFRKELSELLEKYIDEIHRLHNCGILYGVPNEKMINKYLWGTDQMGMTVNERWIEEFNAIVEKYTGKGE